MLRAARAGSVQLALVAGAAALLVGPEVSRGQPDTRGASEPPVMVVDLHVDLPWQVHFKGRQDTLDSGHTTKASLQAGGYGGIVLPIYLPDYLHADGAHIEDAEAVLATIERLIAKNPIFLPLRSARAEAGRVATWLGIEGAGAFAKDVRQLDRFIERGVRVIGPVHAKNGPLASSATGERVPHGLTDVGKELAHRAYQRGALIDVSHLSDAAFTDVAAIAKQYGAPIVATHSNARALAGSPRDLTDAQLRAIAASGGVAGLNLHTPFLTKNPEATMADVLAQVDHMVRVAGLEHVAVGSDFDGGIKTPTGIEDAGGMAAIAAALKRRGMRHDDVLKIFSLNALRVLAWRAPRPGPSQPAPPPRAADRAGATAPR